MSVKECEEWCAANGYTLDFYDDGPGYEANPCIKKNGEPVIWGSDYTDLEWMVRELTQEEPLSPLGAH